MARKFKANDYVFWLSYWPKLTGIYRYINDEDYPALLLRRDGDSRDYKAGADGVFSLNQIEDIITHPSLEQFFTIEKELAQKQKEIKRLHLLLRRKYK